MLENKPDSFYGRPFPPNFHRDQARSWEAESLKKWLDNLDLPTGSKVLEIGCGQGVVTTHLNNSGIGSIGIDVRNDFEGSESFFVADARNMPLKDNSIDVVFEHLVFDEVIIMSASSGKDITQMIRESGRVLMPGGYFISKYFGIMASFTGEMESMGFQLIGSQENRLHYTWKKVAGV